LRSSESPHRSDGASTAVTRLPCPQAPLQSITAAASLTTPVSVPRRGEPSRAPPTPSSEQPSTLHPPLLRKRRWAFRPQGPDGQRGASLARPRGLRRDRQSRPSDVGDHARVRRPETDRLNGRRRPKPQRPHQNSPARRWQATVWFRGVPGGELIVGYTQVLRPSVRSTRSTLRPALRRRRVVATHNRGITSPAASAAPALQLPMLNDRFRPFAHGKP